MSPSKRKAWALEDSKQNRRSSQKRRLLDSEESDGDEKGGHSTRAIVGDLPHLIDDNPFRSPDMVPQDLVSGGQEKGWATLKFGTLRMIFRHLRGDVKALTNASAACKSWMAAGKVCKTELKSVDLSSIRGQRLDALMEALPVSLIDDYMLESVCVFKNLSYIYRTCLLALELPGYTKVNWRELIVKVN